MLKITYTTIVNEHFLPYLEQLIRSHQMFSRIDLTVYTINFDYELKNYKNINFIKFIDDDLNEFELTGNNRFIKNDYEKHKYTTLLKSKVLKNFSDSYDYYFFVDSDILFTKNSDILFINTINEFGHSKFPISVKYFYQYSDTHRPTESIFDEAGKFNPKSLGYYPLIELYNTDFSEIDYLTTYCIYYTRECYDFIDEVERICFDENVIRDYKKYLPLGDETVFNYLYSKYNFSKFISGYLCYNINPFLGISSAVSNLEKINNFVSFIHTKRYITDNPSGKDFSNTNTEEYDRIFDILSKRESQENKINIFSIEKEEDCEIIRFNVDDTYDKTYKVIIVSLFRPKEEQVFIMHLMSGVNYFICKNRDLLVKDTHFIIRDEDIIRDTAKLI